MELSKTAYVILGMVRLGRRTGYEIKSLVDVSTRFFWAASYGQIYPELKRLEKAGLIEGEEDPSGGRQRRAYSLTPAGEDALDAWLRSDEPLHFELRHEGLLKLFLSDGLGPSGQAELLARMRAEHLRVGERLRVIEATGAPSGAPGSVLEFGIAYQEFVVDWCARLERELSSETATAGTS